MQTITRYSEEYPNPLNRTEGNFDTLGYERGTIHNLTTVLTVWRVGTCVTLARRGMEIL